MNKLEKRAIVIGKNEGFFIEKWRKGKEDVTLHGKDNDNIKIGVKMARTFWPNTKRSRWNTWRRAFIRHWGK